ncbi:MAG TPA: hypothetical protein VHM91_07515 [Verrucomicrobiales bacterium]|jgi:hypothetical protein|nr:hypothetical protein [Verrucomicrobiales bacterium]
MFHPDLHLLPEYDGAKVMWLYHDNWLAARVLKTSHPEMAGKILAAIKARGVERSGKIEMIFREAELPFHRYELRDVAQDRGFTIRTEVTTGEKTSGWESYADLLLIAAVAEKDKARAKAHFAAALKMWDGTGFADEVVKKQGQYATYKLGLALHAARLLEAASPELDAVRKRLLTLQHSSGGWITDYKSDGKPKGLANVETTCLAIIGLSGIPAPQSTGP